MRVFSLLPFFHFPPFSGYTSRPVKRKKCGCMCMFKVHRLKKFGFSYNFFFFRFRYAVFFYIIFRGILLHAFEFGSLLLTLKCFYMYIWRINLIKCTCGASKSEKREREVNVLYIYSGIFPDRRWYIALFIQGT